MYDNNKEDFVVKNWKKDWKGGKRGRPGGSGGHIYGLGFIGAAAYYLSISSSFGSDVVSLLKAIVWPAYLVYHLLGL